MDFPKLLRYCVEHAHLSCGKTLHAHAIKTAMAVTDPFTCNRLIQIYSTCNNLPDALQLFRETSATGIANSHSWNIIISAHANSGGLKHARLLFRAVPSVLRNAVTWNAIIAAHAQSEEKQNQLQAIGFLAEMRVCGFEPTVFSYASALRACAALACPRHGRGIHGHVVKIGICADVHVASPVIDLYGKLGFLEDARQVFDEMPMRNLVSWNSMIAGYEQNRQCERAMEVFRQMGLQKEGRIRPDLFSLASLISACAGVGVEALRQGKEVHGYVAGHVGTVDVYVGNALVDMYAKCGDVDDARKVFEKMSVRDVISWTSLIAGYAKRGTAMDLSEAHLVFQNMPLGTKNVVSFNALIAGCAHHHSSSEQALILFLQMKRQGFCPTHYTFGNVLSACASLSALQNGKQIHAHVIKAGFRFMGSDSDVFVGNSLIDMYAKCGSIKHAQLAFDCIEEPDVVSWNAMIVGYAQNGYAREALQRFERMLCRDVVPDHITFVGVLSACSHAGLVDEARHNFDSMVNQYSIMPLPEHYACMVDVLGRAGFLHEAKNIILNMPYPADGIIWGGLLGACRIHGNMELAEWVADKIAVLPKKLDITVNQEDMEQGLPQFQVGAL